MAPDPDQTPRHAACPSCGAALRPGSPWCTLCYADLRPQEQLTEPLAPTPVGDPLTQPLIDFLPNPVLPPAPRLPEAGESTGFATSPLDDPAPAPAPAPTWPCSSCGTANPIEAMHCRACGSAFLATVAQDSRAALVLPVVGDLTRMSRAQRVIGALTVVIVLVLFVAMVTLLLSKRPPDAGTTVITPTGEPTITVVNPTAAPTISPTVTPTAVPTVTANP